MISIVLDKIISLEKWAKSKAIKPLTVMTKHEADMFTQIDKCLGINHKWKVGDEYYKFMCPVPKVK